jgi:hypothetical protein
MKKKLNTYKTVTSSKNLANEPFAMYEATPSFSIIGKKTDVKKLVKEFTYKEFKKIFDKSPFTLAEWADLLFISERTLQRYAKTNAEFSGLHIERILQLEKLIDMGNDFFKKNFKEWLLSSPFSLNGLTPISMLNTYEGIQEVTFLIGRIQHGISA